MGYMSRYLTENIHNKAGPLFTEQHYSNSTVVRPFVLVYITENLNPALLAFVIEIHRWPVDSHHKGPVAWKVYPYYDIIIADKNTFKNS